MGHFRQIFVLFWALLGAGNALTIGVNDTASIKHAASEAAYGMMKFYTGNLTGQIPGLLPPPYYWWEGGAMWMCLIDYWAVTGDSTYNPQVTQSLLFQVGPHNDYMPPNQTASMGNDDQAFWAMAALSAAENNFPNPTNPKDPSWLSLAQAVFNEQVGRWDDSSCGGGLHWQAIEVNKGYSLKNTISNGSLMQIAARLARYLNDDMYADWATKLWDWMVSVKLIDTSNWSVYDNTESITQNCTTIDRHQWTYNAGTLLISCATMWNYTEDEIWKNRTIGLLNTIEFDFFPNGIMKEICEEYNACNPDQHSFKAYLSRWMAATTKMAPFTTDQVLKLLRSSAVAAAQQCTCGQDNRQCGLKWTHNGTCDGDYGPGQQMAAMEVFLGLLVKNQSVPLTNSTGGTSSSNPNAGFNQSSVPPGSYIAPPSRADKAGAWFLTSLFGVGAIWLIWFLSSDTWEDGECTIPGEALTPRQRRRLLKGRSEASVLPQSMIAETIQLRPKSDEIREKAVPIQYLESLPTPPDSPPLDSDSPSLESASPVMSTCRLHETGSGLFSENYTLGYGKGGRLSSVVCNQCRWGGDGDEVSEISRSGGDEDIDGISEVSRSNSGAGSMREKG